MTEEQLEKEIEEKQKQLHDMRYGEIDKAYEEFNKSKEEAIKKYKIWKCAMEKHNTSPNSIVYYFNSWSL